VNLMKIDLKYLQEQQKAGKIKGFINPVKKLSKKSMNNNSKWGSKIKGWIYLNLQFWCDSNGLELKTEHRFHPERKWRFDFAIPEVKIAIEYEGLMSEKSRHTTIKGFTGDTEKYNEAAAQRWKVMRYTARNYKQLLTDLNKFL
jgi:hypothetical protein